MNKFLLVILLVFCGCREDDVNKFIVPSKNTTDRIRQLNDYNFQLQDENAKLRNRLRKLENAEAVAD
jgi:hypothetical protein